MKFRNIKIWLTRYRIYVTAALIILGLVGLGAGFTMYNHQSAVKVSRVVEHPVHHEVASVEKAEEVQPSVDQPSAAVEQTQPSLPSQNTAPPKPAVPSSPPQSRPSLKVIAVRTYGNNRYCESGTVKLRTQYGTMQLNGGEAGTILWQLEGRSGGIVTILQSGSFTVTSRQLAYETPNLSGYPVVATSGSDALRVHITAPNDTASPWYSLQDAGDHTSCH